MAIRLRGEQGAYEVIDKRASGGFVAAERYDAYRPSYPPEAVEFIRGSARLDEQATVVELGAGTGLMTRLLLPVRRLVALEPVPEMREVLRARVPEAEVMDGTAEEIPLPSAIADVVVAAQAFHWFANPRAVQEIARVLRPSGALILVWNVKDPEDPLMERLDAIIAPYRLDSPGFASTPWREVFAEQGSPLMLTSHVTFAFEERLTLAQLKGRTLSASYIALLAPEPQSDVLRRLEELAGSSAEDAPVVMRYQTEVFVAQWREDPRPTI